MALRKRATRHASVRRLCLKPSPPRGGGPTVVQSVDWLAERDGRGWLQIVPLRSARVVTIPEASMGPRPRGPRARWRGSRLVPSRADGRLRSWTVSRCHEGSLAFEAPSLRGTPSTGGRSGFRCVVWPRWKDRQTTTTSNLVTTSPSSK
jgi:hypothetical protein